MHKDIKGVPFQNTKLTVDQVVYNSSNIFPISYVMTIQNRPANVIQHHYDIEKKLKYIPNSGPLLFSYNLFFIIYPFFLSFFPPLFVSLTLLFPSLSTLETFFQYHTGEWLTDFDAHF